MKRFIIRMGICAAIGAVLGAVGIALHIPLGVLLGIVFLGALAWPTVCVRYVAPRRAGRLLRKHANPDWRPPETAEPTTSPLLERMNALEGVEDWERLQSFLADDFSLVDVTGRRYDRKLYRRVMKASARMYRESHSEDEPPLADPARPDVLYVRSTTTSRPWSGPSLQLTSWSRITLAPCGERVREIAVDAVTHVD